MKSLKLEDGDVYFIPLFLTEDYSLKSYSRFKFGEGDQEFCFCRIVASEGGAGILIEIFDFVGPAGSDIESIINRPRLIDPVYIVGDGISKKRWRKVGSSKSYNREKDSGYSKIKFVLGRGDDRRVWCDGKEFPFDKIKNAKSIESHKLWTAAQLENRLVNELSKEQYKSK
ncbi:Imm26 family immunity protein [Microbulbifer sp. CNSA002]|uniref:Imm26 family immunity protein n=1 Tax=unclassified Microbulbifer TaxID=2619833 RepID=UPI0039B51CB5